MPRSSQDVADVVVGDVARMIVRARPISRARAPKRTPLQPPEHPIPRRRWRPAPPDHPALRETETPEPAMAVRPPVLADGVPGAAAGDTARRRTPRRRCRTRRLHQRARASAGRRRNRRNHPLGRGTPQSEQAADVVIRVPGTARAAVAPVRVDHPGPTFSDPGCRRMMRHRLVVSLSPGWLNRCGRMDPLTSDGSTSR